MENVLRNLRILQTIPPLLYQIYLNDAGKKIHNHYRTTDEPLSYQQFKSLRELSMLDVHKNCFGTPLIGEFVRGTSVTSPKIITYDTAKAIKKTTHATAQKKINLVLEHCVVTFAAFDGCDFIDTLTLGTGATIDSTGFERATITDLDVQPGATVSSDAFAHATIENLTVQQGATLCLHSFGSTRITNLLLLPYVYMDRCPFHGATITEVHVGHHALIESCAFDHTNIQRLHVHHAATADNNSFIDATIQTLNVHKEATINKQAFCYATITNLEVQNGATVEGDGFFDVTIIGSAKYGDGSDIPQETLNTWGID